MTFILNGRRKPKASAILKISNFENYYPIPSTNRFHKTRQANNKDVREYIENKNKNNIINNIFDNDGLKTLDSLRAHFIANPNLNVFIVSSSRKVEKVKNERVKTKTLSIYLLESHNVDIKKSKINEFDFSSDTICISPEAFFKNQEIGKLVNLIFVDPVNKKIVSVSHPVDIEKYSKDKNYINFGEQEVEEGENNSLVFVKSEMFNLIKFGDTSKEQVKERQKNMLKYSFSLNSGEEVQVCDEKGNPVIKRVVFDGLTARQFNLLAKGKYKIVNKETNGEHWLVIDEYKVLGEKKKGVAIFFTETPYVFKLKEKSIKK